jgi:hypothetical protein
MDEMSLTYHFRDLKELLETTNLKLSEVSARMCTAGGPLGDGIGLDLRAQWTTERLAAIERLMTRVEFVAVAGFIVLALHVYRHW